MNNKQPREQKKNKTSLPQTRPQKKTSPLPSDVYIYLYRSYVCVSGSIPTYIVHYHVLYLHITFWDYVQYIRRTRLQHVRCTYSRFVYSNLGLFFSNYRWKAYIPYKKSIYYKGIYNRFGKSNPIPHLFTRSRICSQLLGKEEGKGLFVLLNVLLF